MKTMLYIFSGLPGSGKTTIAKEIVKYLKASYFRLDTIEHGLQEVCLLNVQGEGYRLTYRIVSDNLKVGNDVVVDCCNPCELTRTEWEKVATDNDSHYINIEIVCSDKQEHKRRIEKRDNDINGFNLPSWEEVQKKDYQEWEKERVIIETNKREINECVAELIKKLNIEREKFA